MIVRLGHTRRLTWYTDKPPLIDDACHTHTTLDQSQQAGGDAEAPRQEDDEVMGEQKCVSTKKWQH